MHDTLLRRGRDADLPALTAIYDHCIRETAITFDLEPYTEETRRPWLRDFGGTGRYPLFVAERAGAVLGYACTRRFRNKAAYNPASVALHERFGFTPVGAMREVGRKFGRYWDVLWMERAL